MPYLVRLKPDHPGNFRRSVRRDPATGQQVMRGGEVVGILEFQPGQPAVLNDEEFQAVSRDLGVHLQHCTLDDKGRSRVSDKPVKVDGSILDPTPSRSEGSTPSASQRRRKSSQS